MNNWQVVEIKNNEQQEVHFYNKLQQDDGQLKIIKTVNRVDEVHGDAVFQFEIKNDTTGETWYKTISFTGPINSNTSKFVVLENLPYGNYTITELNTLRYTCDSENPKSVTINSENKEREVRFKNKKTFDNNFSHADVIENSFTVKPDGTLGIKQIPVPGETVTE